MSLPPLPNVVILPSWVLPEEPCDDGDDAFVHEWLYAFADVFFAVFEDGVGVLEG